MSGDPLSAGAKVVVGAFLVSGAIHLVRPQVFEPLVPRRLGHARELVYASGLAELACAAGMVAGPTRVIAGRVASLLLAAVFPGNVQMALDAGSRAVDRPTPGTVGMAVGTLARLPLQWPLIRWAWSAGTS